MSGRKRTGTENIQLKNLIFSLGKIAKKNKAAIWDKVAEELSKPSRKARIANLNHIDKNSNNGEVILVPGKVLGFGKISHKVNIAAQSFSESAVKKIHAEGGKTMSIEELVKENPKGTGVKIIVA